MNQPPNICLIHCHDLGQYLGCYGVGVETPRIDALAEEGALFENHFTTAPQCSPSRASLMTGRHPHENGLMGLAHGDWELHEDERVLPEYFSELDYDTHLFGLQHVTEYTDRLGYDEIHSKGILSPDAPAGIHEVDRAREVSDSFVTALSGGALEPPFFASIGFFELHRMENDDGMFTFADDRYEAAEPEQVDSLPYLPDDPAIRRDIAEMQGMVRAIDEATGTVLDALESAGFVEETLVIFTTEHGLAMPQAKGCVRDPGIEGALLVRHPDLVDAGARYEELVSNVDVLPTLLDLFDEPIPERLSGRSFLPILENAEHTPREALYAGMTWHDTYNPMRAVRTDRFKYIRNFWCLPEVYLTNDVAHSPSGEVVKNEFDRPTRDYEQLYDLEADPHERENVVSDPSYEAEAADLRERLHEWMQATDDPLLEGPVPPADFDEIMAW